MAARRKIAIVARGGTASLAPFRDTDWEIWGLPWVSYPRLDVAFEMHSEQCAQNGKLEWYRKHDWIADFEARSPDTIVYCDPSRTRLFKNGRDFPLDAVSQSVPIPYFENSIAYQIAFALYSGATEIGLYGVHMQGEPEARIGKPSIIYMIGLAQGRGVEVYVQPGSPLFMSNFIDGRYGVSDGHGAYRQRIASYAGVTPYTQSDKKEMSHV